MNKNVPYLFFGARIKLLLDSAESGGTLSVFDFTEVRGLEPPPHIHENEDEIFRVIEGEYTFFVKDQVIDAVAGDTLLVPKGVTHTFKVKTETARAIVATTSTDFENFIKALAIPAQSEHDLPQPLTPEQVGKAIETGKNFGLTLLV